MGSIIAGSKRDHPEKALEQYWLEIAEDISYCPLTLNRESISSRSLETKKLTEKLVKKRRGIIY